MHITFSPIRSDHTLNLERSGDTLIVNGVTFDFAHLAEGDTHDELTLESPWFAGPIRREGGVLHLEIALPHGPAASDAQRFPAPVVQDADGPVPLP